MDCAVFFLTLTFRYITYYIVAAIFMCAAAFVTGYWVTGLIGGLIPTMFASLMCGVAYARRTGRRASPEVAWGAGTGFAMITSVGGVAVFASLAPEELMSELVRVILTAPMVALVIVLISLLMTIVASRIFFGLGSRTWHGPVTA
jgi:hypothetical protein